MRRGFGILYGILILVLVASIGVYTLELSSKTTKRTADEHIRLQLQLYMNSSVEYALLWMSEDDNRSQTPQDLNITYDNRYAVQMHLTPLGNLLPAESNGTVRLDAAGSYAVNSDETIRMTRRLILKP